MIYEAKKDEDKDAAARSAVIAKCDKFLYLSCIYQIDFSYRKIETTSMTSEEQDKQFGDK